MGRRRINEEPKPCKWCGATMRRKRFNGVLESMNQWNRRRFCSLSCANSRESVGYDALSWRGRKHLKPACEVCGDTYYLAAHHRSGIRSDNSPKNIETLCVTCHAKHHHGTLSRSSVA